MIKKHRVLATFLRRSRKRKKSNLFVAPSSTRRGGIVIMAVMMIALSTFTLATDFYRDIVQHYMAVRSQADGYRARSLATAGFQAGLSALKMIPEEYLYQKGMILNPPNIEYDKECNDDGENCTFLYLTYRILPEDGKLNLNNLVLTADEPNETYRKILIRYFEFYQKAMEEEEVDLDLTAEQRVNALIDWLDNNNNEYGDGAESQYYSGLKSPQKIKNGMMFGLSELAGIRGFSRRLVYEPIIDKEWREQRENRASMSDAEKDLILEEDWVFSNNLTAYLPYQSSIDDKVNINAARYHVLMSLTSGMTQRAVKAIFELRKKNQGYIKNLSDLQSLPELLETSNETGLSLYQELVGSGGAVSGLIRTKGIYYRVVGVGSVILPSDNEKTHPMGVRRVWGIYEKSSRRLIYYSED